MKLKILIATRNRGKLAELERLLSVYIDERSLRSSRSTMWALPERSSRTAQRLPKMQ